MPVRKSSSSFSNRRKGNARSKSRKSKRTSKAKEPQKFSDIQFDLRNNQDFLGWLARHFLLSGSVILSAGAGAIPLGLMYLWRRRLAKRHGYVDADGNVSVLAWEDGIRNDKKAEGSLLGKIPYTDALLEMIEPKLEEISDRKRERKGIPIQKQLSDVIREGKKMERKQQQIANQDSSLPNMNEKELVQDYAKDMNTY